MFKLFKYILLSLAIYSLMACSSMPLALQSESLIGLSPVHEIENIPFYPQVEDQCGPSSLATMLGVQGIMISPEALRGKLYIPGKEGTVTTEIIARARRFGLLVYPLEADFTHILQEIQAGNPVLVMQNLGFNWLPKWHFSVAIAYDLERRKLALRSGDAVKYEVDFDLFRKTWHRAESWAIVIVSPETLPETATAKGVLSAANQLEQVGEIKAALLTYQSAIRNWPENRVAYFGAGNAAYALGEFDAAAGFFKDYLKLEKKSASAWNNLAYSLAESGCFNAATSAIQCALSINPESKNLQESAKEVANFTRRSSQASCEPIRCE